MAKCYNKIYIKKYDIEVDCGKCLNCLENRKNEATVRILTENLNYINKYFITLTYDPLKAEYDENGKTMLNKKHIKNYLDSLRYIHKRHYLEDYGKNHNDMVCVWSGEYGETSTERAHYHLIIYTNIYIERAIKMKWKYGQVHMERVKDARACAYTTGYTSKKYGYKKQDRKIMPFVAWSRGLGKKWIHEAIASGKVNEKNYYAENILSKNKLPRYFKSIIKRTVMGVTPKYKKLNSLERQLHYEQYGEDRKTIMINQNEYDANYYKWEKYINVVKEEAKKRDILYLNYEQLKSIHGDKWEQRIYNLMYNEKWDEMDEVEKTFTNLKKRINEKLKIEAEQKLYRRKARNKIA